MTANTGTSHVSSNNGDNVPIRLRGIIADATEHVIANRFSAHLAAIVESAADAMISARLDGTILSWNKGAKELFGYSADQIIGSSVMQLVSAEHLDDARAVFARVRGGEIIREQETVLQRKDGRAVEVLQTLAPIRDENGIIIGVSAIGHDITVRRLAEQQLRRRELSLAKAQEIAQIGSWEYNLATGQVTGSAEAHRIAGTDQDQRHSFKSVLEEYIHPDDQMMIAAANFQALPAGLATPLEFRIIRPPEMEERYVRVQAEFIDRWMVVGTLQDITDQKQADLELERARDELRASEAKYRTIVETTREWIWELDVDGVFTFSNPAVESILGYTPEEVIGNSSLLMMDVQDRRQVEAKLPDMIKEGKGWSRWSIRWRHKDGSVRYLESSGAPMFDAAGELVGYRGADRDITSRVQAEETARARERELAHVSRLSAMGEMTAGIAHEINQPLSAISNFAAAAHQVWKDSGNDSDAPIENWLRQINQQAIRCGGIIRGLRKFAQKGDAVRSRVDVNSVMKDSIAILSGVLREHSIQVDLQLPTQELSLLGNETELQQVFVNLLRNGGDAMIDARVIQPRICIHATAKDDMLNVTIEDNGPGVDPGAERNLFDPFFTTREGGMGMGLAISRSIVENHGGRLCVDENASNGARFRVELPLQGASEAGEQKRG